MRFKMTKKPVITVLIGMILFCSLILVAHAIMNVVGDSFTFSIGDKQYRNFAREEQAECGTPIKAYSTIKCNNGNRPAGYLGTEVYLYRSNSSGTNDLVAYGGFVYSPGIAAGMTNYVPYGYDPADGEYSAQGRTAVLYGNQYHLKWTYGTAHLFFT